MLLSSLYTEVVSIAGVSHIIHIYCFCVGKDALPLPTLKDMEISPQRSLLDLTALLRKGASLRQVDQQGFAPYLLYKDLDPALVDKHFRPRIRACSRIK